MPTGRSSWSMSASTWRRWIAVLLDSKPCRAANAAKPSFSQARSQRRPAESARLGDHPLEHLGAETRRRCAGCTLSPAGELEVVVLAGGDVPGRHRHAVLDAEVERVRLAVPAVDHVGDHAAGRHG